MKNLPFLYYYYLILIIFMLLILIIPSNFFKFHPLFFSLLLTLFIMISSLKLNFTNSISWYSYILFLIMIGGLMILFMYFTSLANNQLFNFNYNLFTNMILKLFFYLMILLIYYFNYNYIMLLMNNFYMEIYSFFFMLKNMNLNMMKNLMMDYFMDLNLYIIMYLFFTMICVMMLCNKTMTPLRQNFKY